MSVRSSAELIALCRALLAEDGLVIGIGLAIAAIKTWWQAYNVSQSLTALESAVEVSIEDLVNIRKENRLEGSRADDSDAASSATEAAKNNSPWSTTVTGKRANLQNRTSAGTKVLDEAVGLVVVRGSVQPAYDWTLNATTASPSRSPPALPPATASPSSATVSPSSPSPSSSPSLSSPATVVPRASAISSWPVWSSHGSAPCVVVEKAEVVRKRK